ncbi:hypothetical protein ABPG72_016733 [Tetrahymena utriculariae]
MQTEKYKVSYEDQSQQNKYRSTSVNKQSSKKQLLSIHQKNKSVSIREQPFDQYLDPTQNQKYKLKENRYSENVRNNLPSALVKVKKKLKNNDSIDKDHTQIFNQGFDSKLCLPQLSEKIHKYDDFESNTPDDSLILVHRIPNSQMFRFEQHKSSSPKREELFNTQGIQQNSRYINQDNQDQEARHIQVQKKSKNQSEFINFLDQGDFNTEKGQASQKIQGLMQVQNQIQNKAQAGDNNKLCSSKNNILERFKQSSAQQMHTSNTQQQDQKEKFPLKSSQTVGTGKALKREKRAKSQYEQVPQKRDNSPFGKRGQQDNNNCFSENKQNANNKYLFYFKKKQNDNQIYQNYNVNYPLNSQLAQNKPKKATFQNKQQIQQKQESNTRQQITNQLHDSILSNNILSSSVDINKSMLKTIINVTYAQSQLNKSKLLSPDPNQSLDLNTSFDISMQLKQSPSSPLAQSQTRSLSHNRQSHKYLKDVQPQQNSKQALAKNSPLQASFSNLSNCQTSFRENKQNQDNLNNQGYQFSQNTSQQVKFTKLNLNQTIGGYNFDDQSSKHSFSLLSARLQQSQNNQSFSSPRSVTTTSSYHEKLIYKHIQLLIQQKNGISSSSNSPIQKSLQQLNVESILKSNEDCNRFLRHYFNKVEMLFSSLERKDMDHIILLAINLLDLLVEMNEINLFCQFVLFLGYTAKDFNHLDKAIFFFQQADLLANLFRQWSIKSEALIKLAECAKEIKLYDSSILILKKALQFVWLTKDHERELSIYDNLGLNYFYLGDLENAFYYHEKYMKGETEGEQTATKQLSLKNIEFFEMKQYRKQNKFTRLVMINLSLPIKNIFDSNEQLPITKTTQDRNKQNHSYIQNSNQQNNSFNTFQEESNNVQDNQQNMIDLMKTQSGFLLIPLCDFDKLVTYKNCDGKKIIQKLVSSQEYEYIVQESRGNKEESEKKPKLKQNSENLEQLQQEKSKQVKKITHRIQLPGILVKQNQTLKHEEFKQMLSKMKASNFNLEEKVKEMIKDKTSLQQIMEKVEHNAKNNKITSFQKQKVNLNHLGEDMQINNKKNQTDAYYLKKRYLQILSEIIGEYVFKKLF